MADIDFKKVFETLKVDVVGLATSTVKSYRDEAKTDATKLLDGMKDNLNNWTLQLAEGTLSKNDFEFLVLAQKEVIEMHALKQAGLALIKADELKGKLLNQVINTVFGLL
jgi:hypothetical protein